MNKRENIPKATEELEKIVSNENEDNKFERILKLEEKYPDDVGILQVISRNYLAVGDNTKALNYLLKAKSIEPNNFSIHYNLGTLHQTFKKNDDALEFFKKSIELNKDFINGYNALADLYLKKKNYEETIKYLKASVKIDFSINNINAISILALSIVANYFQTKNLIELKDALIYFKKAHELDPSNDKILKQLISFYHLVGMKNEAVYLSKERTGVFEI
tara:strand:+ start:887 stop:1543 length:657 start_codon:yes stop_codon:yes gene_type:complete